MRRLLSITCLVIPLAVVGPWSAASADQAFHTVQLPLMPLGSEPLHSGFVIDTHANGPTIYAHEVYQLNGAQPHTTYQVQLLGFVNGTDCMGAPIVTIPETALQTNAAGNGTADKFFAPGDVTPFRGNTWQLQWQIIGPDGNVAYQTPCAVVTLD